MRVPRYLIVGAQKCGTSSVYQQLIQHPCVVKGFHAKFKCLKEILFESNNAINGN